MATRAYRVANREKVLAYKRAWNAANRDKALEMQRKASRKWRAGNPMENRYYQHKAHAMRRGVAFLLTLEEWTAIWVASGKWEQRGGGAGRYCMARYGDAGAYELNNVRICTTRENNLERGARLRGVPRSAEVRKKMSDAWKRRHDATTNGLK